MEASLPMTKFQNPLPGDENFEVCVMRQMERGVAQDRAQRVCGIIGEVIRANKLAHEGADIAVLVPVTFTSEGVHNHRLKPWKAIKNAADLIKGTPFFANQPGEHEDGVWPGGGPFPGNAVADKTAHHGYAIEVFANEENKTVTGTIGLLTPEAMEKNGASSKRIEFQKALIKAVQEGGKFAISLHFGAKVIPQSGIFANQRYTAVEDYFVPTSTSLVPRGAEPTAIMNGYIDADGGHLSIFDLKRQIEALSNSTKRAQLGESECARIAQRLAPVVNAAVADGVLDASAIEVLNTGTQDRKDSTMDPKDIRDMSVTALREQNPELNRVLGEHEALKASANADKAEKDKLVSDAAAARDVMASVLSIDAKKTTTETLASLAEKVKAHVGDVTAKLTGFETKEAASLTKRKEKAVKALANAYTAEELKAIEKPGDLAGTVAAFEILANKQAPGEIQPPNEELDAQANFDQKDEREVVADSYAELQKAFAPKEG